MLDSTGPVGRATRERVLGTDYVRDAWSKSEDEFWQDFQRYGEATAWGAIWSRPGLELRDRSLVVLTALAATHREREVEIHLQGALNNGITVAELRELAFQLAPYCGLPTTEFLLAKIETMEIS